MSLQLRRPPPLQCVCGQQKRRRKNILVHFAFIKILHKTFKNTFLLCEFLYVLRTSLLIYCLLGCKLKTYIIAILIHFSIHNEWVLLGCNFHCFPLNPLLPLKMRVTMDLNRTNLYELTFIHYCSFFLISSKMEMYLSK